MTDQRSLLENDCSYQPNLAMKKPLDRLASVKGLR